MFDPSQTPFPGARDGQNLISCGHYLYLQTQFGEDRCTEFRVIVVTDPQTHPPTNRQDRLQYTAPQLASAQCKYFASCLCVAINTERVYQSMQTLVSDDSQTSSDSTRAYESIRRRVAKVTSPSPFRFFRTFHVVITYTPFRPFSL